MLVFQSCACSQYEDYAVECTQRGVDISNWRESVDYCRKFSFYKENAHMSAECQTHYSNLRSSANIRPHECMPGCLNHSYFINSRINIYFKWTNFYDGIIHYSCLPSAYDCPEGLTYHPSAPIPSPTCLDKTPEKETEARGCFCPTGQLLQDGVCVNPSQCKCLYEGKFYNVSFDLNDALFCMHYYCMHYY